MGIFQKISQRISQTISGGIFFNNTINQKMNYFENKEFIDEYFHDKFSLINNHLENNEIQEVEKVLIEIYLKKENVPEEIDIVLLKYQAFVYLAKDNEKNLNDIIEKLNKLSGSKAALQEIKFNLAIRKKSYDNFNKLKLEWIDDKKDNELININEIRFLFLSCKYKEVIERVNIDIYKENKEIMYILGQSLSVEGKYDEAESILDNIKNYSEEYKLAYIDNNVRKYFSKINYRNEVEDIDILNVYINEISAIDKEKLNKLQLKQLYTIYLQLLYFTNAKEAENEFENIRNHYENDYEINILGIDVLETNDKLDEAEKLAEKVMEIRKDRIIISKILIIKNRKENWKDVIDIYNSNKCNVVDDDGLCRYLYGLAIIKCYGEEFAYKLIKDEIDCNNILDLLLVAKMNKEKCEQCLDRICSKVDNKDLVIIDVCNLYIEIGNYKKAYYCLEKGAIYKIEIFKKLISLSIEQKMNYADILDIYYKGYESQNNTYIDSNIYYIAIQLKNYRCSYLMAKKLYESLENEYWTNEYIRMKLINDDFEDLEILVKNIENLNQSQYIITAAEVYSYLGDYLRADELCYKAFYYLDECQNDLDVLTRISIISLKIPNEDDIIEENSKVKSDDIVTLINEKGILLKICLNREIYYQKSQIRMDITYIKMNDMLWVGLLGKEKGDLVEINGDKFKIINIVNKKVYMYRTAFGTRIERGQEQGIRQISIKGDSEEEPNFDEMKETIRDSNKKMQEVINMYINQEDGIGVPVYLIKNEKESLKELLESLIYSSDERIIAGNPEVVMKNRKVVLSLLSVIFLEINNLLDDFLNFYDVYIGSILIKVLNDIIKNLVSKFNRKEISLYLIDDRFLIDEKNEDYKRKRIEFYQNIIIKLNKLTKIDKTIVNSCLFRMPDAMVKEVDIQAIEIANELGATLFIDDYFNSTLAKAVYKNLDISNTAGFIATSVCENYDKYINVAEKLVKAKYQYVFDLKSLTYIVFYARIDSRKSREKFIHFIDMLIENDINGYYHSILKHICLSVCFISKGYMFMERRIDIIINCINNKS